MREGASSFRQFFRVSAFCGLFWVAVPGLFCAGGEEPPATVSSIGSAFVSPKVQVTTMPDAVGVPVEWKYSNLWDFPLLVERFEESCGCLSGLLESKIIEPGESGSIRASFTPGANRGLLRKSLYVRFAGHEKPVELVIEATVPSSVELSGRELDWVAGEKLSTQTIDVTSGTGMDFSVTSLLGVSEKQFSIAVETLVPQRHHRIRITPASGTAPGVHCLQVRTDSKDPRDQVLSVFLRISTPSTTPAIPAP